MSLYNSIIRRKSCRKYDMQDLGEDFLKKVETAIKGFDKLYENVPLSYRFTKKVAGPFHVEAPHYIIIEGKGKDGEMESAGFIFQQLTLWFDANEIGCVWLGESKDSNTLKKDGDIIVIGFGKTLGSAHRNIDEFKRKPIEKITNAKDNICMKAVHLAPSGINIQPWYFKKDGDKVLVYKKRLVPPLSVLYRLADIDMGIALCHYALACKEEGREFKFTKTEDIQKKSGYYPFGLIL